MEIHVLIQVACACRRSHAKCVTSTFRTSPKLLVNPKMRWAEEHNNGSINLSEMASLELDVGSLFVDRRVEKDIVRNHHLQHCKIQHHVKACPRNNPIFMYTYHLHQPICLNDLVKEFTAGAKLHDQIEMTTSDLAKWWQPNPQESVGLQTIFEGLKEFDDVGMVHDLPMWDKKWQLFVSHNSDRHGKSWEKRQHNTSLNRKTRDWPSWWQSPVGNVPCSSHGPGHPVSLSDAFVK